MNFVLKINKFQISNTFYLRNEKRISGCYEEILKKKSCYAMNKIRLKSIQAVINKKLNSWSGFFRQVKSIISREVNVQKLSSTRWEFDSNVKYRQISYPSSINELESFDNYRYKGKIHSIPDEAKLLKFKELTPVASNQTEKKMFKNNEESGDLNFPSTSSVYTPLLEMNTTQDKSIFEKGNFRINPDKQRSLYVDGKFQNPWTTWKPVTFTNAVKFALFKSMSKIPPKEKLDSILPIVKQDFSTMQIPDDGIRVTWIGHSTVLVQMHGLNILTDPMFSDRASLSQLFGPKRYRNPPCSVDDLPNINAVVISHSHYDHLDLNTVTSLNARFGAKMYWFVPLGLQSWMQQVGCKNVVEMDWWEESSIPEHKDVLFVFTPAQHWSKRTVTDDNKVLWGSWSILGTKFRFFFAGDTGYCDAFKQIGNCYGPFDLSAIPIGAYEPRWFMKYAHVNPEEASQIHLDICSKYSLAIHWGTFCLGTENYLDPPRKLQESLDNRRIPRESFFTLRHGESRLISSID